MRESRRLVYVPGAPGSGKTSLAVPLAAELGWALLTKDRIKETLHDALKPPEPDRESAGTWAHDQLASRWCLDPREDL